MDRNLSCNPCSLAFFTPYIAQYLSHSRSAFRNKGSSIKTDALLVSPANLHSAGRSVALFGGGLGIKVHLAFPFFGSAIQSREQILDNLHINTLEILVYSFAPTLLN